MSTSATGVVLVAALVLTGASSQDSAVKLDDVSTGAQLFWMPGR